MFLKLAQFEERSNTFFNSMLNDINRKNYKISTDRFVWQDKAFTLNGKVDIPNAHVIVYINGGLVAETTAFGDGSFSVDIRLYDNENEITVDYA